MSNSTNDMSEKLVQYLDRALPDNERTELEKQLAADSSLQEELENLKLAREAVHLYGLKQEVGAIHKEMMSELQTPQRQIGQTRRILRYSMAVAAGLFFIFIGVTTYNYFTLSGEKLFNENYRSYELSTVRGGSTATTIEKAYQEKDYQQVTVLADTSVTSKNLFLSAMAYMELKNSTAAIAAFNKVLRIDEANGTSSFKDESQYYMALAFILGKQYEAAQQLLQQIKDNPDHLYHEKATGQLIKKVKSLR